MVEADVVAAVAVAVDVLAEEAQTPARAGAILLQSNHNRNHTLNRNSETGREGGDDALPMDLRKKMRKAQHPATSLQILRQTRMSVRSAQKSLQTGRLANACILSAVDAHIECAYCTSANLVYCATLCLMK